MTISFQSILDAETRIGPYKISPRFLPQTGLIRSCLLIYLSKQTVSNAQVLLNLEAPVTLYFHSVYRISLSWLIQVAITHKPWPLLLVYLGGKPQL